MNGSKAAAAKDRMNECLKSFFMVEPIIFVLAAGGLCLAASTIYAALRLKRRAMTWNSILSWLSPFNKNLDYETPLISFKAAPKSGTNEMESLSILYSLAHENPDPDPAYQALVKVGKKNDLKTHPVEFFKQNAGGLSGLVSGRPVVMGEPRFAASCGLTLPAELAAETAKQEAEGRKVIQAGWNGQVQALAVFLDHSTPAHEALQWRRNLSLMAASFAILAALTFSLIFFSGCRRSGSSSAILRGHIKAAESSLENLAAQPNAVCYLIVEDQWGVPVVIKRWLNPKLPIVFKLTPQDLLMPSRPWQGPFKLQAFLFISQNPKQELPPPFNAAKSGASVLVYPGNSTPVELTLRH